MGEYNVSVFMKRSFNLYSNYADMHAYISKHKNIMLDKLMGIDTVGGFYNDMCKAYSLSAIIINIKIYIK